MKKQLLTGLKAALFILAPLYSFSQWNSKGPFGGPSYCVKAKNNLVFAGTGNGAFKSSDNGKTWSSCSKGIEKYTITCMSTSAAALYAGTASQGLFCSTDDGLTWTAKNNGLANYQVRSVFNGGSALYVGTNNGVYFSTNGAASFTNCSQGQNANATAYCWAQMGDSVYAGTYGYGLYLRASANSSWTTVQNGFPQASAVYALYVSGNKVYAGTNSGIYLSVNRGISWTLSNNGMPANKWAKCFASKGNKMFCGTYSEGIYISSNGGASWSPSNVGLFNWGAIDNDFLDMNELEVSGSAVICASYSGLDRTEDDGSNWGDCNEGSLATDVKAIACSGNTVYAGTQFTGMYCSKDNGESWKKCNKGLTSNHVKSLCTKGKKVFAAVHGKKVCKSDDEGDNWVNCSNGINSDVAIVRCDNDNVYAVTAASVNMNQKLYCTKDEGGSWNEVMGANAISGGMSALCAVKGKIYIGTHGGSLYRSLNEGQSWTDLSVYLPAVPITSILDLDSIIIVGTQGKGCFKFMYNGTHMVPASTGLSFTNISDLNSQNGFVFCSTFGGGVFASKNNCKSWFEVNGDLANKNLACLGASSTKLFLGTDAAIYQTKDGAYGDFTILAGIAKNKMEQPELMYPNPSTGFLYIDQNTLSRVEFVDFTGKLVKTIEKPEAVLDLRDLPKGIYIVKTFGQSSASQKVILY